MNETDSTAEDAEHPTEAGAESGTPAKGKKSQSVIVAQRVEDVLRLRIDGAMFADIRDFAVQSQWGVSDSMLKKYIQKADDLLKERTEKSRGKATRMHVARREGVFARALSAGDLRTALAALDSTAKLQGLFEDRRDLEKQLAELIARLSASEGAARADVPR